MPVYSLEGITPVVHPHAYVHETAVLIGDVMIGAGCYIGPNASLRGDFGRIIVEAGANVQDTCVNNFTTLSSRCSAIYQNHLNTRLNKNTNQLLTDSVKV